MITWMITQHFARYHYSVYLHDNTRDRINRRFFRRSPSQLDSRNIISIDFRCILASVPLRQIQQNLENSKIDKKNSFKMFFATFYWVTILSSRIITSFHPFVWKLKTWSLYESYRWIESGTFMKWSINSKRLSRDLNCCSLTNFWSMDPIWESHQPADPVQLQEKWTR